MSDSARAFMAFALIALVLILTKPYLEWLRPPIEPVPEPIGEDFPAQRPEIAPGNIIEPVPEAVPQEAPAAPVPPAVTQSAPERTVVLETALYTAVVSTQAGGSLKSFELKNYPSRQEEGPVQLIGRALEPRNLELAYINLEGDSVYLQGSYETLQFPSLNRVTLDDGELIMKFRRTFPSGTSVTKQLTFQANSYLIPIKIEWRSPELELGINTFEVGWYDGLPPAEALIKEEETYGKVYVYQGGELGKQGSAGKERVTRQTLKGSTDWVALRNKYFAAALIAQKGNPASFGAFSASSSQWLATANNNGYLTQYSMAIGYPADSPVEMNLYLGPLSYFIIKDLDVGLDRIMNLGFSLIRPISKLALFSLVYLHDWIPNYGVVLILFAIAIRVVTNPLTKKSFTSTQKMQIVQPRVKELQEKYKGNAQKLNKEMMALWKSEGVNPLGGCLPILIQLPLLWALFIVFRTTIELRGQPFIWWVKDLSAPDVIFMLPFSIPVYGQGVTVLALIMGVTMFVQQKLSGAGANPQQKPMMYFMTAFFFLIFNQFPSGLNLYYAFSNILAIIQQRSIRKGLTAQEGNPAGAKG
ncbi:MAG: membrane protein insertase YidC [Candidatus Neomarinimicrobiota bacterium]